jgi:CTP:molybdopterin cytidylyltransferase MocA
MSGIAGIVLAAGEGRRAGGTKALLKIGSETFLERIVTAIRGAGCEPVIVVGGAEGPRVGAEANRLGASFVCNANWQNGQFSSLRVGSASVRSSGTAALVALVDHPLVRVETYRALLDAFGKSPGRIVIPLCEDTRTHRTARGHPVIIPADVLAEIAVASEDVTLRDIISRNSDLVLEARVDDPGVLKDIDTAADLKEFERPVV